MFSSLLALTLVAGADPQPPAATSPKVVMPRLTDAPAPLKPLSAQALLVRPILSSPAPAPQPSLNIPAMPKALSGVDQSIPSSNLANCKPFYDAQRGDRWTNAYLDNAIRACRVTGTGEAANSIRKCLQEKTLTSSHRGVASALDLYEMHKQCYDRAGCLGSPAPLWGWKGVNNVSIPSDRLIKWGIDYFGPCSGVRGQFEPSAISPQSPNYPSLLNTKPTTVWDKASLLSKPDAASKYSLGVDTNIMKSLNGPTEKGKSGRGLRK